MSSWEAEAVETEPENAKHPEAKGSLAFTSQALTPCLGFVFLVIFELFSWFLFFLHILDGLNVFHPVLRVSGEVSKVFVVLYGVFSRVNGFSLLFWYVFNFGPTKMPVVGVIFLEF